MEISILMTTTPTLCPWTETFFEFAKSNQNDADDQQQTDPAALSILEKGLLKSNYGA